MDKLTKRTGSSLVLALASLAIMVPVCIGCASIMHGTRQDVGISSSPSQATVYVDNKPMGKTPLVADLRRKDNHVIRIEMPGYQPFETTLIRKVSAWVLGNILFGGLIGLAVDAIDGALYKLTPEQVQAELNREGIGYLYREDAIYIVATLSPDPSWEKVGTLGAKDLE